MQTRFRRSAPVVSALLVALSLSACGSGSSPEASSAPESATDPASAPTTDPASDATPNPAPNPPTEPEAGPAPIAAPGPVPNSAPVTADEVALAVSLTGTKTFSFNWSAVAGATRYRLLEDPDGTSGYTQIGPDLAGDAVSYDLIVPLFERINARYILQSCIATDCTDSDPLMMSDNLARAVGLFKSSSPRTLDAFGGAISLSADGYTLAVGADWEEEASIRTEPSDGTKTARGYGAVYVFTRDSDTAWMQQAYLSSSKPQANDRFGSSVSLSEDGNTLAVGASQEGNENAGIDPVDDNDDAADSGAVYVFTRDTEAEWTQQAYLKSSKPQAHDLFGIAVSLSHDGDTLAVGGSQEASKNAGINPADDNDDATGAGAVYVFTRDSEAAWTQQAYLKASSPAVNDYFGIAVSLSGDSNTLAVGANGEDNENPGINPDDDNDDASASGAVYVFTRGTNAAWTQQTYLKSSNPQSDKFGGSVSLSEDGNTLAVGADREDNQNPGINPIDDNNSASASGAVYVFARDSHAEWSQQAYIKPSKPQANDLFGSSVTLSTDGNTLAVGAIGEDNENVGINQADDNDNASGSGAVYVFTRNANAAWKQQAYLKASGAQGDRFGRSVSLSEQGNLLAIGADGEANGNAGINPDDDNRQAPGSGAVYLF